MRGFVWFFGSFVLVLVGLFIYNSFYLPIVESEKDLKHSNTLNVDIKIDKKSNTIVVNDVPSDLPKGQKEKQITHDNIVIEQDDSDVEDIYISDQEVENAFTEVSVDAYTKTQNFYTDKMDQTCLAKGGRLTLGTCQAKFNDAHMICKAMDKKLLSIKELENIVIGCNGIIAIDGEDRNKNSNNKFYQDCYQKIGFSPFEYWSSTASKDDAFVLRFNYGSVYTIDTDKSYSSVYCTDNNKNEDGE